MQIDINAELLFKVGKQAALTPLQNIQNAKTILAQWTAPDKVATFDELLKATCPDISYIVKDFKGNDAVIVNKLLFQVVADFMRLHLPNYIYDQLRGSEFNYIAPLDFDFDDLDSFDIKSDNHQSN